jgi:hypothetical protein
VPGDGHCLINAVIIALYGQYNLNSYINLKNMISNEILNNGNEYIEYSISNQENQDLASRLIVFNNSMQEFIFNKYWNQDLVDIMPLLISKIIKYRLKIFKLFHNNLFQQYDVSYNQTFTDTIYLKLNFNHYQAINIINNNIDQLSTSIIATNLNKTSQQICIHCNQPGHQKYTNKNCLKYNQYKKNNKNNLNNAFHDLELNISGIDHSNTKRKTQTETERKQTYRNNKKLEEENKRKQLLINKELQAEKQQPIIELITEFENRQTELKKKDELEEEKKRKQEEEKKRQQEKEKKRQQEEEQTYYLYNNANIQRSLRQNQTEYNRQKEAERKRNERMNSHLIRTNQRQTIIQNEQVILFI